MDQTKRSRLVPSAVTRSDIFYGERPATLGTAPAEITASFSMTTEPESGDAEHPGKTFELKAILVVLDDQQLASALQCVRQNHSRACQADQHEPAGEGLRGETG